MRKDAGKESKLGAFSISAKTVQWLKHSDSAMGQFNIGAVTEPSSIASKIPCPLRVGMLNPASEAEAGGCLLYVAGFGK